MFFNTYEELKHQGIGWNMVMRAGYVHARQVAEDGREYGSVWLARPR